MMVFLMMGTGTISVMRQADIPVMVMASCFRTSLFRTCLMVILSVAHIMTGIGDSVMLMVS